MEPKCYGGVKMSERAKSKLIKIEDLLKRDDHNHFLYINYDKIKKIKELIIFYC